MQCIAELFLHLPDRQFIPLRCFDGDEPPTLGKVFAEGRDTLSWAFGRHPQWCDVVWEQPLSAIHFTIFYDRSIGDWLIQDGGYYPTPLKMVTPRGYESPPHQSDDPRGVGFNPSTLGTYLNGEPLSYTQPSEGKPAYPKRKTLYPGDRIFAAGKKIYVSDTAAMPHVDWQSRWVRDADTDTSEVVTAAQAQDLLAEQQSKAEAVSSTGLGGGILALIGKRLEAEPPWVRALLYVAIAAVAFAFVLGLAGAAR